MKDDELVKKSMNKNMSPELVAANLKTCSSISEVIKNYNELPICSQTKDEQLLSDHQGYDLSLDKQQNKQQYPNLETFDIPVMWVHPTHQSALETSQKHIQYLLAPRGDF